MDIDALLRKGYSRRRALQILTAAAGAAAISGLHLPRSYAQTAPANLPRGGVLRIAIAAASPEPLDPVVLSSARAMSFMLWDRLTWIDANQNVQPELALSWSSNPDLTVWTFKLRQDVTFHNDKHFTSKDVVATFARILDPKKGGQPYNLFNPYIDADRVVPIDDYTVEFRLKEQLFNLPSLVAGDQISIMPAGASDDEIRSTGTGTGPFKLKEYAPNSHLISTANPNYWRKGFPLLDGIEMYKVIEAGQRVSGLLAGQFDAITELTPLNKRQLATNQNVTVVSQPSANTHPFIMLGNQKPFDDNRVRLAIKKAVDRQRMVQQLFLGEAIIGNDQPIPPFSPLSGQVPPLERDIAGAKKLLAEAGYANGLDITLATTGYVADHAVLFAESLKEAGINVTVQSQPTATFVPNYNRGAWPLFNSQYGMRVDNLLMDFLFVPTDLKQNMSRYNWRNDAFTKSYKAALGEADAAKRLVHFTEVQRILRDEGNIVMATLSNVIEAHHKKVLNYKPNPTYHWRQYWNVAIAKG